MSVPAELDFTASICQVLSSAVILTLVDTDRLVTAGQQQSVIYVARRVITG